LEETALSDSHPDRGVDFVSDVLFRKWEGKLIVVAGFSTPCPQAYGSYFRKRLLSALSTGIDLFLHRQRR
jgi:hypothetical protein